MLDLAMNPAHPPPPIHFGEQSRVADFILDDDRAMRVASSLLDAGAYLIDTSMPEERYYTWKSGVRAPCYCNCRNAISNFDTRRMIAIEMSSAITENFEKTEALLGVSTAGIPWATTVADKLKMPTAYIRSKKKSHGVGEYVQGCVKPGSRVVVVDDLVASGGSLKGAIDSLVSEVEVQVVGVISIINWGFPKMRENLNNFNFIALTSYPQVIMAATSRGKVSQHEFSRLLNFYTNPLLGY